MSGRDLTPEPDDFDLPPTRWSEGATSGGDPAQQRIAALWGKLPPPAELPVARLSAVRARLPGRTPSPRARGLRPWAWALAALLLLLGSGVVAAARGWVSWVHLRPAATGPAPARAPLASLRPPARPAPAQTPKAAITPLPTLVPGTPPPVVPGTPPPVVPPTPVPGTPPPVPGTSLPGTSLPTPVPGTPPPVPGTPPPVVPPTPVPGTPPPVPGTPPVVPGTATPVPGTPPVVGTPAPVVPGTPAPSLARSAVEPILPMARSLAISSSRTRRPPTRMLAPVAVATAVPGDPSAPPAPTEASVLEEAVATLRRQGDARAALKMLDGYDDRFANGLLAPEADRLRIDAWLVLGDRGRALQRLNQVALSDGARDLELRLIRGELRVALAGCAGAREDFSRVLALVADGALAARARAGVAACARASGAP